MRRLWIFLVTGTLLVTGSLSARAGEIDQLLQKLVDKGVLTAGEAQTIATETKEEIKKQNVQGKNEAIPQWIQNIKLSGDFRLRYQYDHAKKLTSSKTQTNDESRGRIRARVGLDAKVNDQITVGVGIATGSTDTTSKDASRSGNVTLAGGFAKKTIDLDYAYVQYAPTSWATIIAGRMRNPLWEPSDFIWDGNIRPEGGVVKLDKNITDKTELFMIAGGLIVDESAAMGADPTMIVIESGVKQAVTDNISFKGAVSYYGTMNARGKKLPGTVSTNTVTSAATGALKYEYDDLAPMVEIGFKDLFAPVHLDLPYFGLYGEFVDNVNSDIKVRKTGFIVGNKFGAEKIDKWADWQVDLNYAMLGKDAILDILPNADRYGGKTGIRAYRTSYNFGLGKNNWLTLCYYHANQLPGNFGVKQTKPASVVQVDWNVKF